MDGALLSGFMLFAALFFVALNGVFVLAEFSFATIRSTKVEGMVRDGRAGAGIVQEATRKLDAYLAVCQLGITISSLSLGALGEPAIASLIEPFFETWGVPDGLVHPVAFAIGFFMLWFRGPGSFAGLHVQTSSHSASFRTSSSETSGAGLWTLYCRVPFSSRTAMTVSTGGHPGSVHRSSVTINEASSPISEYARNHSFTRDLSFASDFGPAPNGPTMYSVPPQK